MFNWFRTLFGGQQNQDRESDSIVSDALLKVDLQKRVEAIVQLHKGPRGGVYTINSKGRKRYVK